MFKEFSIIYKYKISLKSLIFGLGAGKNVSLRNVNAFKSRKTYADNLEFIQLLMLKFKDYIQEENTQGDIGTDKLTNHRKKLTPGQPMKTGEMLPDYCECENRIPEKNK